MGIETRDFYSLEMTIAAGYRQVTPKKPLLTKINIYIIMRL